MRDPALAAFADCMGPEEPLSVAGQIALECWGWCGGWHPERWPVYEALHPVPDWHHTIELMRVIRAELHKAQSER